MISSLAMSLATEAASDSSRAPAAGSSPAYTGLIGFGVALLSVSLMTTELVFTRIFSVIAWYHFAFFVISVALFGGGAAAIVVHLRQRQLLGPRSLQHISGLAAALTAVIMASDLLLVRLTPGWFSGIDEATLAAMLLRLLAVFAFAAAPFFVGGLAISLAVTSFARQVHRLYFADLVGAGAGCLLAVPVLEALGGPRGLLVSAAVAAAASVVFALASRTPRRVRSLAPAAVALACVGVVAAASSRTRWLEIPMAKGIGLEEHVPEYMGWNSFSMVAVFDDVGFQGWGRSPRYEGSYPEQKTLVIDMGAMTTVNRFDGDLSSVGYALHDLSALAYRVVHAPEHVCIIGAGGGKDVLAALAGGARHVTAVEINPLIVEEVVKGRYSEFTGHLYERPDVDIHVEDGRAFVRRTDQRFDLLLLSMVDTSAATAAGAYSLTENSLYTTDAIDDFLTKLQPDGVLSVSTTSLLNLAVGARLAAIARQALRRRGAVPFRSIAVLQTPWLEREDATMHTFLLKPDGFAPEEVSALARAAEELDFVPAHLPGVVRMPETPEQHLIARIITAGDDAVLTRELDELDLDVTATTDERPFFFYQNRLSDFPSALLSLASAHPIGNGLVIVAKVLAIALFMVLSCLLVPLLVASRETDLGPSPLGPDLGYVGCLGVGFMLVEIALLQRLSPFLGDPTRTLAVVLFVLLVAGGLGSRLFSALSTGPSAREPSGLLKIVLGALVVYATLLGLAASPLLELGITWTGGARAALAAALLAPLGLLLGMPFPAGLSAVAERAPHRIPWLWGINSATSVLGSVLATLCSLHFGISATLLTGTACYLGALALWPTVARPTPATG